MNNPETHTCPTCGYVWLHGKNGSHNCDVLLIDRIEKLESALRVLCKHSQPFTNDEFIDETSGTIPLMDALELALKIADEILN